jgi:hypothetical protein
MSTTRARAPKLPPVSIAKLEEIARLLEHVVSSNSELFIANGQRYRDVHRKPRPLTPLEATHIAVALGREDEIATAERVQQSELHAYDEPDVRETLLQAGIATAPAFMEGVKLIVALIEMDGETFKQAREQKTLLPRVEQDAQAFAELDLKDGRDRAMRAFTHLARSAGVDSADMQRLPIQAVWQTLNGAIGQVTATVASSHA